MLQNSRIIDQTQSNCVPEMSFISKKQHAFSSGRTCLTNLLECCESWTRASDEGFGVDVLYLDYRKTFDSVPIKRLLEA